MFLRILHVIEVLGGLRLRQRVGHVGILRQIILSCWGFVVQGMRPIHGIHLIIFVKEIFTKTFQMNAHADHPITEVFVEQAQPPQGLVQAAIRKAARSVMERCIKVQTSAVPTSLLLLIVI